MSRLPQISARECVNALPKAGFYVARQRGSHIIVRRDQPFARVSAPNYKVIKLGTLRGIINDAGLTVEEFLELL